MAKGLNKVKGTSIFFFKYPLPVHKFQSRDMRLVGHAQFSHFSLFFNLFIFHWHAQRSAHLTQLVWALPLSDKMSPLASQELKHLLDWFPSTGSLHGTIIKSKCQFGRWFKCCLPDPYNNNNNNQVYFNKNISLVKCTAMQTYAHQVWTKQKAQLNTHCPITTRVWSIQLVTGHSES